MIQVVEGSERWYCRVHDCRDFTVDNVPFGRCALHALEHLGGAEQVEKGFPPIGTPTKPRKLAASSVSAQAVTGWQPVSTHDKSDRSLVLVSLIRDGVLWRASDAKRTEIGWFTKSGENCHWATHWMPLPAGRTQEPSA